MAVGPTPNPEKIAHYRLIEQIGAGGMGVVWRAHDERLERDVAIKLITPSDDSDPAARKRFRAEAVALTKINHPNIATVFDFGSETLPDGSERDYVVMELIPGTTLVDRLHGRPLERDEFLPFAIQLVKGIVAAHDAGVLHRDLKPANLRITPDGHLKILDFGLAKTEVKATDATASVTAAGTVMGTVPYMSPEQLRGEVVDAGTDIYAAGAVLFEMATGRRPFEQTGTALMDAVLNEQPSVPSAINRKLDAAVDAVVLKGLEKRRELRYQSAREMLVDLQRMASISHSGAIILAKAGGSRNTWKRAAVVVFLLLAIASAGFWLMRRQRGAEMPTSGIGSLAVLPLQNMSGDASQEYFSQAMTEELTNEMASLRSLKVISRTSASRYAPGGNKSAKEIASELGVDALIEGSVLRSSNKVRITVQLIDGKTDRHVWSKSYERVADDIMTLQREVATAIAHEINVELTPAEKKRLQKTTTKNPEAYEAYLRAKYRLETGISVRADADLALSEAEKAVALDEEFAEAHVALAQALATLVFGYDAPVAVHERAMVELGKALSLNPELADAYGVRGALYYNKLKNFDIRSAVADYRKAISLNPNLATAYGSLGSELTHSGLHAEAVEAYKRAIELDPHFYGAKGRLVRAYWQSNHFEEAVATYRKYGVIGFDTPVAVAYLQGTREAWELVRDDRIRVWNLGAANFDLAAVRGLLFAKDGKAAEAEKQIAIAVKNGEGKNHFHHSAFLVAAAYAEMGKAHEAVRWLRYDTQNGMPNYPLFRENPSMKKLAGNKEYEEFMSELKPKWEELAKAISGQSK
jgi:eukaryotic-like serine/threonine-protein kinase